MDKGLSIAVWIKTNSDQTQNIVSKLIDRTGKTKDDAYSLGFERRDHYFFENKVLGAVQGHITEEHHDDFDIDSINFVSSSKIINDGKWHHVAFIWEGSGFRFWIDGQSDSNITYYDNRSTNTVPINSIDSPLVIGATNDNNTGYINYFHGYLDDLRIYNRSLSDSEISDLYGGVHWITLVCLELQLMF